MKNIRGSISSFICKLLLVTISASLFTACKEQKIAQGASQTNNQAIHVQDSYEVAPKVRGGKYGVDIMGRVTGREGKSVALAEVSVLSSDPACEIVMKDSSGFVISTDTAKVCDYQYSVLSSEKESREGDLTGFSRVVVTPTPEDATLTPFGKTAYYDEKTTIDLEKELEKVGDLSNLIPYTLREDVTVLPADSNSIVTVNQENNTLEYTPSADSTGNEQILYSFDNGLGGMVIGSIFVATGNRSEVGVDIQDKIVWEDGITLNEKVTMDVSEFVDNIDEQWQLVYVSAFNATVEPSDAKDMNNKSFTFQANMVGDYYVNVVVSDHRGGYDVGLIQVRVVDPNGAGKWGNILHKIKLFYAPLSLSDAQSKGVEISGTYFDEGVKTTVSTFTYPVAKKYCDNTIGRLPTPEELKEMYRDKNPPVQQWPVEELYWTQDPNKLVSLFTGNTSSPNPHKQYNVTCINEGEFSIFSKSNKPVVADGIQQAIVKTKLTYRDKPVSGQVVTASSGDGFNAEFVDTRVVTDDDGIATFFITDRVAEKPEVVFDFNDEVRSTTLEFVPDPSTADLELEIMKDNAPTKNGTNVVLASVLDELGNPFAGQPISFSSSSREVEIVAPPTTDSDGKIKVSIVWQGDKFAPTQQVELTAATDLDSQRLEESIPVTFIHSEPEPVAMFVKVDPSTIDVDQYAQATATVVWEDSQTTSEQPAWSSTGNAAEVSASGTVRGKQAGTSTIRASFRCASCENTVTGSAQVHVNQPPPKLIAITIQGERNRTMDKNQVAHLDTKARYDRGPDQVVNASYRASSDAVRVSGSQITAEKPGTAVITASYKGKTDQITVTVKAQSNLRFTSGLEYEEFKGRKMIGIIKDGNQFVYPTSCFGKGFTDPKYPTPGRFNTSPAANALHQSSAAGCIVDNGAMTAGTMTLTAVVEGETLGPSQYCSRRVGNGSMIEWTPGACPRKRPPVLYVEEDEDYDGEVQTDKQGEIRDSDHAERIVEAVLGKRLPEFMERSTEEKVLPSSTFNAYWELGVEGWQKRMCAKGQMFVQGSGKDHPCTSIDAEALISEQRAYEERLPENVKSMILENAF